MSKSKLKSAFFLKTYSSAAWETFIRSKAASLLSCSTVFLIAISPLDDIFKDKSTESLPFPVHSQNRKNGDCGLVAKFSRCVINDTGTYCTCTRTVCVYVYMDMWPLSTSRPSSGSNPLSCRAG